MSNESWANDISPVRTPCPRMPGPSIDIRIGVSNELRRKMAVPGVETSSLQAFVPIRTRWGIQLSTLLAIWQLAELVAAAQVVPSRSAA